MSEHELIEAYLETSYRVDAPGGAIMLRIGRTSPELDALLERAGVQEWAFVTAWNPCSKALPEAENGARHAALQGRLEALGLATLPGAGVPSSDVWPPEQSLLVLGIDRATARAVGREFGQNAIVVGESGGPAELLVCTDGGER